MTLRRSVLSSLLLLIGASISATAMPIVSVMNPPSVSVGESFDIDVMIDDVLGGPGEGLHDFEFDFEYNPSVIDPSGYANGDFLQPSFPIQTDVNPPTIEIAVTRLGPDGIPGGGRLFSLSFIATTAGQSPLVLSNVLLSKPFGMPLTPFEIKNSSITVTDSAKVPEPATGALLLLGLVALASRARRKRHS